jgi:hypothetical protein
LKKAIRDLIEEIQNQGPKWKRHVNIGVEIDRIKDQIEKIGDQLKVKMHKFKTKDQSEKGNQLQG